MKKTLLVAVALSALSGAAFATDDNNEAGCKGGVTGNGNGFNADVAGLGNVTCSFSGESKFETRDTFDLVGTFEGASSQTLAFSSLSRSAKHLTTAVLSARR